MLMVVVMVMVDGGFSGDGVDGGGGGGNSSIGCSDDCVDSGDGGGNASGGESNESIVMVVVCDADGGSDGSDSDVDICGGRMAEVVSITTAHTLYWEMSTSEVSPCWELWLLSSLGPYIQAIA